MSDDVEKQFDLFETIRKERTPLSKKLIFLINIIVFFYILTIFSFITLIFLVIIKINSTIINFNIFIILILIILLIYFRIYFNKLCHNHQKVRRKITYFNIILYLTILTEMISLLLISIERLDFYHFVLIISILVFFIYFDMN